jgi:hypothetical protein
MSDQSDTPDPTLRSEISTLPSQLAKTMLGVGEDMLGSGMDDPELWKRVRRFSASTKPRPESD